MVEHGWRRRKIDVIQTILKNNFIDCRGLRKFVPSNPHDIRTEKDSAISLMREVRQKTIRSVRYWGVILPEETSIIDINKMKNFCSNCINGVYTNVWVYADEIGEKGKPLENLFILSPNYEYPAPFGGMIDCGK